MKDEKDLVARLVEQDRIADAPAAGSSTYIQTAVAEQIVAAVRYAAREREFVVIVGPSGVGKTTSARAAAAEVPESIYVTIRTAGATALGVLRAIAEQVNVVRSDHAKQSDLFAQLEWAMKGTERTLIIDECHKLAAFRRDEGLHVLSELQDATGVGMCWVGMPTLSRYIQAGRCKGMECLYSRVALWLNVEEAARAAGGPGNGPAGAAGGLATVEDIRKMIAARKLRLTPRAVDYLAALAREEGAGALRTVDKVLKFAAALARDVEINLEMLRGIQSRRLGFRVAEAMENRMETRLQKVGA